MRSIKIAAKHIRRSPYQATAAILVMVITFFVATVLALLAYSSSMVLRYYETRPQVIAFLKDSAETDEISSLQKELEKDLRLKDLTYVTKGQALEIYRQATYDNPLLSEFVSPEVFPASLEFSVVDLAFAEAVIRELETNKIVDQVKFTANLGDPKNLSSVIESLRRIAYYIRVGGAVAMGYLIGSSLLVLLVVVGMRIASRREEIEILALIGATPGFIRSPFVWEGIFYAVFGALLGWVGVVLLVLYTMPAVISYFGDIPVLPSDIVQLLGLLGIILGVEILIALFLGILGSLIALARYLKI